jgi:pyridoxal phosphate enzyme (YggS family)
VKPTSPDAGVVSDPRSPVELRRFGGSRSASGIAHGAKPVRRIRGRFGMSIRENLERVKDRIAGACLRAGRSPEEITLVAVTKTVEPDRIQEAVDAGVSTVGENRVQEAEAKMAAVSGQVAWHMIGHLQRNKAAKAVAMFDMIQSVDSLRLAREIDRRCAEAGRSMDILVEINTSGEGSKFGIPPAAALDAVGEISDLPNLALRGLMTIGAFTDRESVVRKCFSRLRGLAEEARRAGASDVEMHYLSMGMTSDFEPAIEEGSNMVRIGTAIFGPRQDRLT